MFRVEAAEENLFNSLRLGFFSGLCSCQVSGHDVTGAFTANTRTVSVRKAT